MAFTPYEMHKAQRFTTAVLDAAQTRKAEILAEAKKIAEAKIAEAMLQSPPANYQDISAGEMQHVQNKHSAALLAAREQLFELRAQLVGEIFSEVENRLAEFTKTSGYKAYILAKINTHLQAFSKKGVVVYLRGGDMPFADDIKKVLPECKIAEDESIVSGGVKIVCGRILYNYTFDDALADERTNFYETSGLVI